ncbi:MAG: tetratricopeptide repeat protein [Flavobacteriales bacterium]|nr:tetratricopeptide repeat protein [Flavobacteriales bacterium]
MASLVGVHVLFIAHFVHWKLKGRTLAPLEFNEVLYTIHQGIVTAGFILMALVMVATLVFGRFFCSWGCHILALQDAAGWLMDKLRIKRQPIRSRTLIWVPVAVMFYLFIWPQLLLLWHGVDAQAIHLVQAGGSRWSSFTTDNLWRNLPPPGVAVLTFFVCGFVIVYLLGSRGFCFQACPYGALFGIADQLAPGRIVLAKDCSQCGLCTKACTSDILVHRELAIHGMVTNPRCLKDLDCITVCPENAVQYGFRKPPLFRKGHPMGAYGGRFGFSLGEDFFMLGFSLIGMFVYRGLYDAVPFLLAVALALCTSYLFVVGWRLVRQGSIQVRGLVLKIDRRLRPAGIGFAGVLALLLLFFSHSAYVQCHTQAGRHMFERLAEDAQDTGALSSAIAHYELALGSGLLEPTDRELELAALYQMHGDRAAAIRLLTDVVAGHPEHIEARFRLGTMERDQGNTQQAMIQWQNALEQGQLRTDDRDHQLLLKCALELGAAHEASGQFVEAINAYQLGSERLPGEPEMMVRSGAVESRLGMDDRAIEHYEQSIRMGQNTAVVHNNLGALYMRSGDNERALRHFQRLSELVPNDARVHRTLAVLHGRMGRTDQSREQLQLAVRLDPSDQRSAMALASLNGAAAANEQPRP